MKSYRREGGAHYGDMGLRVWLGSGYLTDLTFIRKNDACS